MHSAWLHAWIQLIATRYSVNMIGIEVCLLLSLTCIPWNQRTAERERYGAAFLAVEL